MMIMLFLLLPHNVRSHLSHLCCPPRQRLWLAAFLIATLSVGGQSFAVAAQSSDTTSAPHSILYLPFVPSVGQADMRVFADQAVTPISPTLQTAAAVLPLAEFGPTLSAPVNGMITTGGNGNNGATHPPLGVPALVWQPIQGATQYQVEVSTSAGFASLLVNRTTVATSFVPDIALADGDYFWRVKANVSNVWGPYSEIYAFTKDWSNGGVNVPQLLAPAHQATRSAFGQDDFSWTNVPGAATYKLEITTDPAFSQIVYSATTIKPQHTPTSRLANNSYYWRVIPLDAKGNLGQSSAVQTFTFEWRELPELLSPVNAVDLKFVPRFEWTAIQSAKTYQLQISTGEDFSTVTVYNTPNTEYTPVKALANDQDYFWRVKGLDASGTSSPWSEVRRFRTRWNFQAQLLTPPNNSIAQTTPYFSWTPIPGVERYQIQVDESTSFQNPLMDVEVFNNTNSAFVENKENTLMLDQDYFWRVRGIDAQDNHTAWSSLYAFRFGSVAAPNLVYPPYYYAPDNEHLPVHRDLTIAWPLFVWNTTNLRIANQTYAPDYYQVTVAADPGFQTINFEMTTASLAAAPTLDNPFVGLQAGQLYYWRVRAYRANVQLGVDTVWVTRIDQSLPQLPATPNITPIYPGAGFEAVGAAPVLGWQPVTDANYYRVEISRDPSFTMIVDQAEAQFVNYVPWQGRQEPMPFGTYWWRVRAESAPGVALGDWSEVRHFNLSVDLVNGNRHDLVPPLYPNTILSATAKYDPALTFVAAGADNQMESYGLGDLHVMLNRVSLRPTGAQNEFDNYSWLFAFESAALASDPIMAGIYIDIDHIAGSGGSTDPLGKPINTNSLYWPEYVIYVKTLGAATNPNNIDVYTWSGSSWSPAQSLTVAGGDAWYADSQKTIQIKLPYTVIGGGSEHFSGSLALTVFSTDLANNDGMRASVPAQGTTLNNPAFVSDMLMPLYPFDTPLTNPMTHYDLPSMRWRVPYVDSVDGYQVQVARDAKFTDLFQTWEFFESSTGATFQWLPDAFTALEAYPDNESYYWRVRIRHERFTSASSQFDYGPWSPAMRFKLDSRMVGNPMTSTGDVAAMTPSFHWTRVEAAAGYTIQIDDDANFSNPLITEKIASTSYTPLTALADGNYFWRVMIRRSGTIAGHWSPTMSFVKRSVTPILLTPINEEIINEQPTFLWSTVLTPTTTPRIAAARYQLEVDSDPNFSSPARYTTSAPTYTLAKSESIADGTFYWRVGIIDSNNKVGAYSAAQRFYKEYVPPNLLRPAQGEAVGTLELFEWAAVPGAAYYQFDLDDNPNFASPKSITTDNVQSMPTDKLALKDYYWRVRIYDADRKPGPFITGQIGSGVTRIYLPLVTRQK